MLIRRVVQDQLDDDAQTAAVRLLQEVGEVLQRPVARMDARVVRDVIPIVAERRGVHRLQPQAVHAERGEMIELRGQAGKVADAVAVAVGERLDVELVEDGVHVPERICRI